MFKILPQILISSFLLTLTNGISLDWAPFSKDNMVLIECVILIGFCSVTAFIAHKVATKELSLFYMVIYGVITGMVLWIISLSLNYYQSRAVLDSPLIPAYYNDVLLQELVKITTQRVLILTPILILCYWLIQVVNQRKKDKDIIDG